MIEWRSIYWSSGFINDASGLETDAECCVRYTDGTCRPGIALAHFSGDYTRISPDNRSTRHLLKSHLVQLSTTPRRAETDRKGTRDQASSVLDEAGGAQGYCGAGWGVYHPDDGAVEGEPF